MHIDSKGVYNFFQILNQGSIEYVLIKNVGNELPNCLEDGKDIDILVRESDKSRFERIMLDGGFERIIHPLGSENGWSFGYKLPKCQFWKKSNIAYDFFIDVNFKLCCKSLIPKVWIPLDVSINTSIWENKKYDAENNWWIMDDNNVFVYLIARSVFDKRGFEDAYIAEIESQITLLEREEVRDKLSKIFFQYTAHIIQMIKDGNYSEIVNDYISFSEY